MFEKWRIKQHMEVTDSRGQHVGTVDDVEDGRIRLTRTDSPDGTHHHIDLDAVERIEDNRVYLQEGTTLPFTQGTARSTNAAEPAPAAAGTTTSSNDPAVAAGYGGTADAGAPSSELPVFGTSGHGTGVGGSGVV